MKLKMTVAGSGNVSVLTRSNGSAGSTASSSSVSVARTRGSISATRRGVNARDAGRRRRVCAGGSRVDLHRGGVGAGGGGGGGRWGGGWGGGGGAAPRRRGGGVARAASAPLRPSRSPGR